VRSPKAAGLVARTMPDASRAAAFELFAVLRELDALGVALIWVEHPPASADWDGVRDRLQRAAAA
jgi:L-threonylcarbamoyladenylate synthase